MLVLYHPPIYQASRASQLIHEKIPVKNSVGILAKFLRGTRRTLRPAERRRYLAGAVRSVSWLAGAASQSRERAAGMPAVSAPVRMTRSLLLQTKLRRAANSRLASLAGEAAQTAAKLAG